MLTLFLAYMFLNVGISLIPVLGELLPVFLIPVFTMTFMEACKQVENGQKVQVNLLLAGFRSGSFWRLMSLGSLYFLAILLAVLASQLFDGGDLLKLMSSTAQEMDPKKIEAGRAGTGILGSLICFLPALMAFWYAPPLIMWQRMSLVKAMFFSFMAVKRAWWAFIVYGFCWLVIAGFVPVLLLQVLAAMFQGPVALVLILMPLLVFLTVIRYCSFYPTYQDIFDRPDMGGDQQSPDQGASTT